MRTSSAQVTHMKRIFFAEFALFYNPHLYLTVEYSLKICGSETVSMLNSDERMHNSIYENEL